MVDSLDLSQPRIVVSGYPRSGNTFLRSAIKLSYTNTTVPFHIHNAAYVMENKDREIFAIPVRHPADAIASWDYYRDNDSKEGSILRRYKKDSGFFYYLDFYEKVNNLSDNILMFDFNKFTTDIDYIYQKLNKLCSPSNTVTLEQVKQYLIDNNLNINLQRDNKELLEQYKEKVIGHPDYNKTLQLYNSIINKGI